MRPLAQILLLTLLLGTIGCQSELKRRTQSAQQMKALDRAIHKHLEQTGRWPATLAEIEPFLGQADELGSFNEMSLAELLKNPLTGDNPGYEYVNPEGENRDPRRIILFQLRDGKRDETLVAGLSDGRQRKPGE